MSESVTVQITFPEGTSDRDVELILERVRACLAGVCDCAVEIVSDEEVEE